ncbi:hypothetical protein PsYK624_023350 [Phanerochaete sordida]|uniref:Uncharacterized protein n=1 Tax=Phanerochaete sordida TaxID=48140 RepID=A0A9P3G1M3_9APHY|nr:hypothetical protein PsYK624_023350 [Phanerochaete sordida]
MALAFGILGIVLNLAVYCRWYYGSPTLPPASRAALERARTATFRVRRRPATWRCARRPAHSVWAECEHRLGGARGEGESGARSGSVVLTGRALVGRHHSLPRICGVYLLDLPARTGQDKAMVLHCSGRSGARAAQHAPRPVKLAQPCAYITAGARARAPAAAGSCTLFRVGGANRQSPLLMQPYIQRARKTEDCGPSRQNDMATISANADDTRQRDSDTSRPSGNHGGQRQEIRRAHMTVLAIIQAAKIHHLSANAVASSKVAEASLKS